MSNDSKGELIALAILLIIMMGAIDGWLIMLGAGILHGAWSDFPAFGYLPTGFWLGMIMQFLFNNGQTKVKS